MKKTTLIRLVIILISISLNVQTIFSQTHVSGTIDGETWTKSGSPYIVDDNLLIANLVIEPGVKVMSNGNYELEVAGILKAIGTEQDSIIFTTTDTIVGWQGIFFNVTTFESTLQYCKIENSTNSGIRVINSTPTFENCLFSNNSAPGGGAIYFFNDTEVGSEFTLTDCSFINNQSSDHGGALYVALTEGHLIIANSLFDGNLSNPAQVVGDFVGGAIYLRNGDATILNNEFIRNRSYARCTGTFGCNVTARGGAIYLGSSGNVIIENNIFLENQTLATNNGQCFFGGTSNSYGGAVYVNSGTAALSNNIFAYNKTTRSTCGSSADGGGVYVNGGTVTITNCNVINNPDASGIHCAGSEILNVVNSIIFFNNQESTQIGGNCNVTYSNVQDGYSGEGNKSNNPAFVKDDSTFHITSISPCIDAGNSDELYNDVCFPPSQGNERNDMGAYGGPGACNWFDFISDRANILSFNFAEQSHPAIINMNSHIINIGVINETDLKDLAAIFKVSSGAIAKIGVNEQVSGVTTNDFTNPVIYTVTAEDGTSVQDWAVNVNATPNSETEIVDFTFGTPPQTGDATIDATAKSIDIEVEYGTVLTNLVSTFTLSDGATAKVQGIPQQSGLTVLDFTNPVVYTIIAEDGASVQEWIVTVSYITGITENSLFSFNIYPNPFSDKATIEFNNPNQANYKLSVFTISGNKVFEMDNITSDKIELKRSGLKSGVYIVELKGEKVFVIKMVIVK